MLGCVLILGDGSLRWKGDPNPRKGIERLPLQDNMGKIARSTQGVVVACSLEIFKKVR